MELSPEVCSFIRQTADALSGAPRRRFMARAVEQLRLSQRQAQRYFGWQPTRPVPPKGTAPPVTLAAEKVVSLEDRVQLPRVYLVWPSPAAGRGLMYDLAKTLEKAGELSRALAVFVELEAEAGNYRDVAYKILRLSKLQAKE